MKENTEKEAGIAAGKEFSVQGFSGVDVSSAIGFEITQSGSYSVKATGDQKLVERLKVEVSGKTLKVGLGWLGFTHCPDGEIKVLITMPELRKLTASGAATGSATGFKSDHDLDLELSGASHAEIDIEAGKTLIAISGAGRIGGNLKAQDTGLKLSGAGRCLLKGTGADVRVDSSGASRADLSGFQARNVDAHISGAGRAMVNVDGTLSADLSGASLLEYAGNVTVDKKSVTGASRIRRV
jgi:hypothetical protein